MSQPHVLKAPSRFFGRPIQRELNNPLRGYLALILREAVLHSRTVPGTYGQTPSGAIGFVSQ